jgi:hypothetical protein
VLITGLIKDNDSLRQRGGDRTSHRNRHEQPITGYPRIGKKRDDGELDLGYLKPLTGYCTQWKTPGLITVRINCV